MSTPPLLDVDVRSRRFGGTEVLRGLKFTLREGEIAALVGASGCGKSTLLRIVAGLDREADARVLLDGRPVTAPLPAIRFVFQEPRLFPWLTVAQNIAFDQNAPRQRGEPMARGRVEALLAEVGLDGLGARLPKQLSGGQAQRVAIARGLYLQPRLLLLDEPFSAVDAFTRLKLQDLLLRVARANGITVLMVTHDIDEAIHLSDRVLVLAARPGRLVEDITVDQPHPRERSVPADSHPSHQAQHRVRTALQAVHAL